MFLWSHKQVTGSLFIKGLSNTVIQSVLQDKIKKKNILKLLFVYDKINIIKISGVK